MGGRNSFLDPLPLHPKVCNSQKLESEEGEPRLECGHHRHLNVFTAEPNICPNNTCSWTPWNDTALTHSYHHSQVTNNPLSVKWGEQRWWMEGHRRKLDHFRAGCGMEMTGLELAAPDSRSLDWEILQTGTSDSPPPPAPASFCLTLTLWSFLGHFQDPSHLNIPSQGWIIWFDVPDSVELLCKWNKIKTKIKTQPTLRLSKLIISFFFNRC